MDLLCAFVQYLQLHIPKVDLIPSHSIVCVCGCVMDCLSVKELAQATGTVLHLNFYV